MNVWSFILSQKGWCEIGGLLVFWVIQANLLFTESNRFLNSLLVITTVEIVYNKCQLSEILITTSMKVVYTAVNNSVDNFGTC